ncbi:O-antigen ligase family protein [Clostridium cadaveris]|uniref:O-antigen ligase family protein n=1 Tax=Clostridium cadaveris TaxID=1529 RepID=UPI0003F72178|nr:O-antigen ligase family protein [Clostridium cadaveris]
MKRGLDKVIDLIMICYVISIYIFTYRQGLNVISNALAFILIGLIWFRFFINKEKLKFNKILLLYLIFILICAGTIFYAISPNVSIVKLKTLILLFLFMISLETYIDTIDDIKRIMKYFICAGFITSIYILVTSNFANIERFGGELGNVNSIGMIIGISTTFCFYFIIENKRYDYIILFVVMFFNILLTGSRKSVLFIMLNMMIILFCRNRKSFKKILKIIIFMFILLGVVYYALFKIPIIYEVIGERFESLFAFVNGDSAKEGSVYIRAYMTKFGLDMFRNRPFTGYGLDCYRFLLLHDYGKFTYAHNNYVELMVDTGIFGVTVYYLTHIVAIKDLWYVTEETNNKTLCYTFIAIIISYIVLSTSLIYYEEKHFAIVLVLSSLIPKILKRMTIEKNELC